MDLIVALIAAALALGGAAVLVVRSGAGSGEPGPLLLAGAAAGAVAAMVFLVTRMDLVPDQFDRGAQLFVFALSGVAIGTLGWRRRRGG